MTTFAPTMTHKNLTRVSDLTPEGLTRLLELAEVMKDPSRRYDEALRAADERGVVIPRRRS